MLYAQLCRAAGSRIAMPPLLNASEARSSWAATVTPAVPAPTTTTLWCWAARRAEVEKNRGEDVIWRERRRENMVERGSTGGTYKKRRRKKKSRSNSRRFASAAACDDVLGGGADLTRF